MKTKIALILLVLSALYACKKNDDAIPNVAVNEYIDLNLPSYFPLNAVNGWVYYNAGVKGLIIFRKSTTEFVAIERTCSFDPSTSGAVVEVESNNIIAIDSICGSRFSLFDGSIVNGPATRALQQYKTEYLVNNRLHIYN